MPAWGLLALGLLAAPAGGAGPYEEPPTLSAAELLPAAMLKGPHHTVDPEAETDGFMAYFTIQSDYGAYRTASIEEAATRVREIQAIATLDDMKRYEVAGQGVAEGVKQPFLVVKNVATRPGETLQNVGEGIGRLIERGKLSLHKAGRKGKKAARGAKDSYDQRRDKRRTNRLAEQEVRDRAAAAGRDPDAAVVEYRRRQEAEGSSLAAESDAQRQQERIQWAEDQLQKAALKFIGYDKARRLLAQDLGVDPYSSNLPLQERLDAMAWALWTGRISSGFVIPSSNLLSFAQDVDRLVWSSHPKDLEVQNRRQLRGMGVDKRTVNAFFENDFYTTTDRTHMVADLASLSGVRDRRHFFRLAAAADGWLQGTYYRRSARVLARTHVGRRLDRIFEPGETIVAALTRGGVLVLVMAVDHLAWTEGLDLVTGGVERQCRAEGFEGDVVLLLGGDLTSRARRGVEALGWTVETWGLERVASPASVSQ